MTQQPASIDEIAAARDRLETVRREVMRVYVGNTRVVVPKVRVIAIGPAKSATPDDDAKATNAGLAQNASTPQNDLTLVTVAVNQDDAERLILLTQTGLPYLALHGPNALIKPDDHLVPQFPPPAKK